MIISRLDAAYVDVASLAQSVAGTVRVAGLQRFAPRRAARALRCFHHWRPTARVTLVGAGDEVGDFELLRDGSIDVTIGELRLAGSCAHAVLEEDPYVFVVSAESPLACSKALSAEDLAPFRLTIPRCWESSALDERLRDLRSLTS